MILWMYPRDHPPFRQCPNRIKLNDSFFSSHLASKCPFSPFSLLCFTLIAFTQSPLAFLVISLKAANKGDKEKTHSKHAIFSE